jgi:hypothetical protein
MLLFRSLETLQDEQLAARGRIELPIRGLSDQKKHYLSNKWGQSKTGRYAKTAGLFYGIEPAFDSIISIGGCNPISAAIYATCFYSDPGILERNQNAFSALQWSDRTCETHDKKWRCCRRQF